MAITSAPEGAIGRTPSGFLRRTAAFFLPLAVLATATCGLAYAETQQALRSGANDPQVQLAEDAGRSLRVVEEREANAELIAGAAWLAMLAALAAASVLAARLWPRREAPV